MPRIKQTTLYTYDELNDAAKERAREDYRQHALNDDWWDATYEDIATVGKYLGIDLNQKPVKLMNGSTRYDPCIYFTGFYHQGQGSSYQARWRMCDVNRKALEGHVNLEDGSNSELKVMLETFEAHQLRYPDAEATVTNKRDTFVSSVVELGDRNIDNDLEYTMPWSELEYGSAEYRALDEKERGIIEEIEQALENFNHWIFQQLQRQYEWLNSDEQITKSIRANGYEYTERGKLA